MIVIKLKLNLTYFKNDDENDDDDDENGVAWYLVVVDV